MTIRSHQLPASLDVPVPASPKDMASPAPLTNKAGDAQDALPPTAPALDHAKVAVGSDEGTGDKIASCEDKDAAKASQAGKSATSPKKKKEFTPSQGVQAAIDRCLAVRNASGSFMGGASAAKPLPPRPWT